MKFKRTATALLAACLVFMLAACNSGKETSVAANYNGGEVAAGVYILNQMNALNEAYSLVENPYTDISTQQVKGISSEEWMNNRATELVKTFVGTKLKAAELGVTVENEELDALKTSISRNWSDEGAYYEKLGVSLSSAEAVAENSLLANQIFKTYYAEDGSNPVSEQEYIDFFNDSYRRVVTLVVAKTDSSTGTALEGDALAEKKAIFDDYVARAKNGEAMVDLIIEEDNRSHGHTEGENPHSYDDSQIEMLVRKTDTSYSEDFIQQVFAATELNTPLVYEHDNYFLLYEIRDTMGDGSVFEKSKLSLLDEMKGDEFRAMLTAFADENGFALNQAAVKKFTLKNILEAK